MPSTPFPAAFPRSNGPRLAVSLGLLLVAACAPSSGSGGSGTNEGEYSVESFGYVDPQAESFHPLGEALFPILRRDEVALFRRSFSTIFPNPDSGWVRDDASAGFDIAGMSGSLLDFQTPQDATVGRFDDTGWMRAALVVRGADGSWALELLRGAGATLAPMGGFELAPAGAGYEALRVTAGDVDGDGRDELLVAASRTGWTGSWVRVYEDLAQGGLGSLLLELPYTGRDDVRAAAGQLDDDGPCELVVFHGAGESVTVSVLDDALTGFTTLVSALPGVYDGSSAEVVTGNFDGDPYDEIAVLSDGRRHPAWPLVQTLSIGVTLHDDALAGFERFAADDEVDPDAGAWWEPHHPAFRRSLVAADTDLDGRDELAWLVLAEATLDAGPFGNPGWRLTLHRWSPADDDRLTLREGVLVPVIGSADPTLPHGSRLVAVDDDADGRAELVAVGSEREIGENPWVHTWSVEASGSGLGFAHSASVPVYDPDIFAPVLAGGDFDGDGTLVRWTGDKSLCLPEPMPICVLSAPPTKAGIAQNRDGTQVSYGLSTGTTESFEVSTGTNYSVWAGFEVEDLFGSSGFSAKTTLSTQMESTLGEETTITTTKSFLGSWDQDYVVFQGTLYTCYEYEVVSSADPSAVGTRMALNVPVDAKTYKWTLDFYNQTFAESAPIDPALVLGHGIGDPASYPRRDALVSLLQSAGGAYEGWEGESQTVGQGSAEVGFGLTIAESVTEGESVTYSVESEAEFKVGGAVFGASYGVSEGYLYEITVSHETSYDATVGDIADPGDWNAWAYDTGLVAYTREEAGEPPFQVVRFWVEPFGTAYVK